MSNERLQVTIEDGVLVKAVETKTENESQSYIDFVVPEVFELIL